MAPSSHLAHLTGGRVERAGQTVLRDLSVTITAGSLTMVTGANGSGKSTLLSVLAGLHPLSGGTLSVANGVRRALVPQRSDATDALPLTVADVVTMGRWFRPRRRDRRDDRLIVADCVNAVGLRGLERVPLGALSGGQRQRALLAQGLAQRAHLLLLDEPAAGLDRDGHALLARCIDHERSRGAAVVLVTHDPVTEHEATQHVHVAGGTAATHA